MTLNQAITEYLGIHPEMTLKITSFLVINHNVDIVSTCIKGLRAKGLSHEQIGVIFKMAKGTVFRLEKKDYFPKKEAKQLELLKIALENL